MRSRISHLQSWNHTEMPFSTKTTISTSEDASYAVYTALFFLSLIFFLSPLSFLSSFFLFIFLSFPRFLSSIFFPLSLLVFYSDICPFRFRFPKHMEAHHESLSSRMERHNDKRFAQFLDQWLIGWRHRNRFQRFPLKTFSFVRFHKGKCENFDSVKGSNAVLYSRKPW